MNLISIDPHVKTCSVAWFRDKKLKSILPNFSTKSLIEIPNSIIKPGDNNHLVVERPWVGKNKKGSITLAITVGKIMGSLIRDGFEIHEAPAWGNEGSWIADMLSTGRRMPTTGQVKEMSMRVAMSEYPSFTIDEHSAAAICMGLWFMRKQSQGKMGSGSV